MAGFIKLLRADGYHLLEQDPDAYLLLSQIALRARRYDEQFGSTPLKANQALIGDYKKLKLSRDKYRRAKTRLEKYGLVTFQSSNKGTIATLTSNTIFDINANDSSLPFSSNPPSTSSMKTPELAPSNHQQKTKKSPSYNQQKTNQEPLTRMKEEKKERTTTKEAVPLYKCLESVNDLCQEDKLSLMQYSEDRVKMALEWAPLEPIKKDLISALHWHCRQPTAPKSTSTNSSQQKIAFQFNQLLREHGFEEFYNLNLSAIAQDRCHIVLGHGSTTISLKNPLAQVKKDLEESKTVILQMKK